MDIQFLIRRVLKEGHEYARDDYDNRSRTPAGLEKYYLNRYTAQVHLLNHLEKQFLEGNKNDEQD
jgi:hypothetical protein